MSNWECIVEALMEQSCEHIVIVEPSDFTLFRAMEAQGYGGGQVRCDAVRALQQKLSTEEARLRNAEAETLSHTKELIAKLLRIVPAMSDRTIKFVQRQQSR